MRCPNCGAEVPDSAVYCPYCGYSLRRVDKSRIQRIVESAIPEPSVGGNVINPPLNSLVPNLKTIFDAVFKPRRPMARGALPPPTYKSADVIYIVAMVILLGLGIYVSFSAVPIGNLFLLGLALSSLPAVAYLSLLYLADRYEREPLWLVALSFAWGVASTVPAIVINTGFASVFGLAATAVVSAPLVEEVFKSLFVYYMFTRSKLSINVNSLTDGFLYGFASGLGFGFAENILYMSRLSVSLTPVDALIIRSLTVLMHGFTTGIVGWWLAYIKLSGFSYRGRSWDLFSPLLFAVAVHATWNGTAALLDYISAGTASTVVVTLYAVGIAYLIRKVVGEALRDEVATL